MLKTENVTLDLLEEVEFHFFTGSDEDVDLVKLLFMCKKALKKMVINVADDVAISDEVHEKIKSFSHLRSVVLRHIRGMSACAKSMTGIRYESANSLSCEN